MNMTMKQVVLGLILTMGLSMGLTGLANAQGNAAAGEAKTVTCQACHGASGNDSLLPDVPRIGGQNAKYLLKQMQEIKDGTREVLLMSGMLNNMSDQDLADIAAFYESQAMPQGAADPDKLALGERLYRAGDLQLGVAACTACHSPTGKGNAGAGYPALSGQDPAYLEAQLKAFRAGQRVNDDAQVMRDIAARLNDAEISAVSSYASGLR